MRDVVITQNITVDGIIEATDDWFERVGGDPELDDALAAFRDASDGFLVGRVTFEGMRDYWGAMSDDTTEVSDHLNRVAKYVVSSTLTEDITRIESTYGSDIVCTGNITLCRALIAAGLVDEYRSFTYPHARGRGQRLFADTPPQKLTLAESRVFPSGATLARYRVDPVLRIT